MFSRPVHSGFLPHLEINWSATSPKQERTAATGNWNAKNQAFRTIDIEVMLRDRVMQCSTEDLDHRGWDMMFFA